MKSRSFHGRFFWTLFFGMAIFVSATQVAAQSPSFTVSTYPFLGNSHLAADLNGDGILDLAGTGQNSASVMLGNGDGTFRAKVDYPAAGQAQDLAAGDFNSDGKLDLAVTINTPQISLSLLTGNGDGTFNAPINFPNTSGFDSPAVVATDLNNDSKLDVVIAHQIACFTAPCTVARTITVMLGNGDGTFQPSREIDVGTGMAEIAVGDFNRDGIKDLGIPGGRAQLYTLIGVGDGTFVQRPTVTLISENTLGVDGTDADVADFNNDSIQDLVVAIALNGSRTAILIGNGDGSFRAPSIITEPNLRIPHYQAVADYNGDGKQDLALGLGWGTEGLMEILTGNGDGTFQPPVLYVVPPPQSSISGGTLVAGDFNRDGKPDIALQVVGANPALNVLINSTAATPSPTPAPPAAPTLVSPANNAKLPPNQSITFSWNAAAGAATYEIQIDDSKSFSAPLVVSNSGLTQTQTSHTFTIEGRFWWRVRGRTAGGTNGAWSSIRSFEIKQGASLPTATQTPASALPTATSSLFTLTPTSTTAPPTATSALPTATPSQLAATPTTAADTVSIQLAEYSAGNQQLRVEATSSNASATLTVYVSSTNTLIGTLRNEGGGRYRGDFSWSTNPQSITVRSNFGGQATRTVTLK